MAHKRRVGPPPLYKYMERQWAEALVKCGRIRIGTLYDYRRTDEAEGTNIVYSADTVEWAAAEDAPEFYKQVLGHPLRDYIRIEGIEFRQPHMVPDAYIHCMSEAFSADLMKRLAYDACVRIRDPRRFLRCITDHLIREGLVIRWTVRRCTYVVDRKVHHRESVRPLPGFTKEVRYAHDQEVRAVWVPVPGTLPIGPLHLELPELCETCSLTTKRGR